MNASIPRTALTLLWLPAIAAASETMQPGLWEITTRMDTPAMPMHLPPQTVKHCYTAQDVSRGERTVPRPEHQNCTVKDYKLQGKTATWAVSCVGKQNIDGSGSMTVAADRINGKMKMTVHSPEGPMEITQNWSGRRIGECRK